MRLFNSKKKKIVAAFVMAGTIIGGGAVAANAAGGTGCKYLTYPLCARSVASAQVVDGSLIEGDLAPSVRTKLNTVGNGKPGLSAYEIAVKNGFKGTEAQWLASLPGKDGTNGTNGTDGKDGANGTNGTDGKDGKDGAPGLSELQADGPYPGSTDLSKYPGGRANSDAKVPADGKSHTVWVQCGTGKVALGGGFRVGADQGDAVASKIQVTASEPTQIADGKIVYKPIEGDEAGSIQPNGWLVEAINTGDTDATVRPWVTCAKIAS